MQQSFRTGLPPSEHPRPEFIRASSAWVRRMKEERSAHCAQGEAAASQLELAEQMENIDI